MPAQLDGLELDPQIRLRCEAFARPLYAGLDGVDHFDDVSRVSGLVRELENGPAAAVDREQLDLMVLFHGIVGRLGRLGAGGRFDLFLKDVGVDEARRRRLRVGLERFSTSPHGLEESLLHDAVLLGETGIEAAVGRLLAEGRKKTKPRRAVERLDPGPAVERFVTAAGRRLAAAARERTAAWINELRQLLDSSGAGLS